MVTEARYRKDPLYLGTSFFLLSSSLISTLALFYLSFSSSLESSALLANAITSGTLFFVSLVKSKKKPERKMHRSYLPRSSRVKAQAEFSHSLSLKSISDPIMQDVTVMNSPDAAPPDTSLDRACHRLIECSAQFLISCKRKTITDAEDQLISHSCKQMISPALNAMIRHNRALSDKFVADIDVETDWDLMFLKDITTKYANHNSHKIIRRDQYQSLVKKLNMCGPVFNYHYKLFYKAKKLFEAGHTSTSERFEKDYALLKAKKEELETFCKNFYLKDEDILRKELTDFINSLSDINKLEQRWELTKSYKKLSKKNLQLRKLSGFCKKIEIERKKLSSLPRKNPCHQILSCVFKSPELACLVPALRLSLPKEDFLDLLIEHIIPGLKLFITEDNLTTPISKYFEIVLLLQSLCTVPFSILKTHQFDARRDSTWATDELFTNIKTYDDWCKSSLFWRGINMTMKLSFVKNKINQLPTIVSIMHKHLIQLLQPGPQRDGMVAILSDFSLLTSRLKKEKEKAHLDLPYIIHSFSDQIVDWTKKIDSYHQRSN